MDAPWRANVRSLMELRDFFKLHPRCALGFSGGADSAYLLAEGLRLGADIKPYFVKTAFQPAFELEDAKRLCGELGVALAVLELDILALPEVRANPPERCYYCKRAIFSLIAGRAARDGYGAVIDGTNASDDISDRPGWRAITELGVLSPLRDCGISKPELRERSAALGLFTAGKPAYACLATRVPTGTAISEDGLERVERSEEALAAMGYTDFRVRLTAEGGARIELPDGQLERAVRERREILARLKGLFRNVTVNLEGR